MPYAPGISYDASPILHGSIAGANAINQGITNFAAGLSGGITGYAKGNAEDAEKAKMTSEELDFLGGMAGSLKQQGAITDEEYQKFLSGGIGAKRAIVSVGGTKAQQNFKMQLEKLQHSGEGGTLNLTPQDQAAYDQAGYLALRTSGKSFQAVPKPLPEGGAPQAPVEVKMGDTTMYYDPIKRKYLSRSANFTPPNPNAPLNPDQMKLNSLNSQSDELIGLEKGQKTGFLGLFGQTKEEAEQQIQAQKNAVLQRMGKAPQAASPAAPNAQKVLTPEITAEYLRRTGGDVEKAKKLAAQEGYK